MLWEHKPTGMSIQSFFELKHEDHIFYFFEKTRRRKKQLVTLINKMQILIAHALIASTTHFIFL